VSISFRSIGLLVLVSPFVGCASHESQVPAHSEQAAPQNFQRTPLPETHPMLGVWRVEIDKSVLKPPPGFAAGCIEEYTLRTDGTKVSRSGEERNESEFMITPGTVGPYWFKWVDKITANNGKPDCTGSLTPPGDTSVTYVLVHPSGQRFAMCERQETNSCYAEFFRQTP
jgi:hypothetical protein